MVNIKPLSNMRKHKTLADVEQEREWRVSTSPTTLLDSKD